MAITERKQVSASAFNLVPSWDRWRTLLCICPANRLHPNTSESVPKPHPTARGPGASAEQRDQESEADQGPCLGGQELGEVSAQPQLVPAAKQLSSSHDKTMQCLFSRGEPCTRLKSPG